MRISVFSGTDGAGKLFFLGHGAIIGEEIPGYNAVGYLSSLARSVNKCVPKILLDSGDIVWGTEVWWMSYSRGVEYVERLCEQDKMVAVTAKDMRNRAQNRAH